MVAIVSGEGLGLSTSSLSTLKAQGRIGDAQQGRGNDRSYLNIANGNLVIQSLDEHLAGPGLAIDSLRTYNSQGQLNGEYLDSPLQPTRLEVQGGLSSANSRITRIDDQGHSSVYVWDASRNAWLNTDGDGAYDSIGYDKSSGTLTWTDGSSGVREIHQRVGDDWMLMSRADADGNRLDFSYDKYGRLVSVVNRNGEGSWYDYSGTPGNSILTQVRTLTRNGAGKLTSVRVRYGYDSLERITSITVDLSPDDASVADGRSYVTRYDYEGSSNRISAVYQDDGSVTRFSYIKLGSDWRIASFSNALGETTRIDYLGNSTWVTDPLGLVTRYDHDDAGQLLRITAPAVNGQSQVTQFAWNSRGDLVQMTDARGLVTTMQYDANGNQVYVRDGAGNVLTRQVSAQNLLLSETVYLVPDPDGPGSAQASQARTTQYVYDSRRHLRFAISAEGRVTEYRYNASGQRISQFSYAAAQFGSSGTQTEAQMAAWAARQDPRQMLRTDWVWDFRGQLQQQRTASALDAQGAPAAGSVSAVTRFVYDPFGLLLQTISPEGGLQANTWDGLGRLLSSTDALGNTTLTRWDDRGNRVSVQAANGLLSTGVYDRAGRLLAQADSNPQGQLLAATTYRYDADGRLISVQDPSGVLRHLLYDAAGRQVGEIDGRGALTQYRYDAAGQVRQQTNSRGHLTGITDQAKGANNRSYANDARGIALEIRHGSALQRQLVANGEVLGRYGTGPDPVQSKDSDNNPLFATGADLNFTWQVVNGQHPGMQPGSYTVTAGDSLQSIARQQYGDSRLWYLIADANGLSASTALQSGQKLNLPSVPGTSADRANTFKPYDASQLIGDTTPTLPPPPPDDGGCGVLGLIVVVVVAVVVTIATAGAAAPEAASVVGASTGAAAASASITASGYFATGLSALAGEYGVGTAIVAGAVGGAAGSIASQLVGIGLGVQDGFSWSGVALGAISTAVGGSLAKFAPFEGAASSLANTVARTALGNVVTQGIGVVAGLQSSFNWTSVAASAVGSGVGWEVGDALGTHASAFANAEFTERLVKTSISGFSAAATTAVARGGRLAVQQVAVDAFGNALGNSLVETDWSGTARGSQQSNSNASAFSADMARRRAENPLLMAMYDRNQFDAAGTDAPYLTQLVDNGSDPAIRDLVYRPGEDDASMTLAAAAAASRRSLFSTASNNAFRDRIAGIDDPTEIALQQLDRLRQAGVISHTQYADVVNGYDQSREAYGRAVWDALNARTSDAIASNDPVTRNSKINAEYFARFSENPDAYWMGLATVASDLVGQGLSETRFVSGAANSLPWPQRLIAEASGLPGLWRTTYAGLAEGNLRVASDMLPIYDVFNNLGGYKGLSAIGDVRVDALTGDRVRVPDAALNGYRLLDEGRQIARGLMAGDANAKFAASLNRLAEHEQGDVLQPVYDKSFFGKTLGSAVDSQLRLIGAGNAVIWNGFNPLAPNVLDTYVDPNTVLGNIPLMSRSLGALDQRMTFVGKIADTFVSNLNRMGTSQALDFLGKVRLAPGTLQPTTSKAWSL